MLTTIKTLTSCMEALTSCMQTQPSSARRSFTAIFLFCMVGRSTKDTAQGQASALTTITYTVRRNLFSLDRQTNHSTFKDHRSGVYVNDLFSGIHSGHDSSNRHPSLLSTQISSSLKSALSVYVGELPYSTKVRTAIDTSDSGSKTTACLLGD